MIDVVDSQIHLFRYLDAEKCLAAMDALGIRSVLIDEAWNFNPPEAVQPSVVLSGGVERTLVAGGRMAAMMYPDRFRYLLRVDHRDPDLDAVMKLAADDPHCRAFRSMCHPELMDDLGAGRFDPVFRNAAALGLPLFIQTIDQTPNLVPAFEKFPDCRFVIDHVGLVKSRESWEALLAVSRYPNVYLKWCHANLSFPAQSYPYQPIQAALREAADHFGAERILWASDAGMQRKEYTWANILYYVHTCELLSVDERAWILGRSARELLDWPLEATQ